MAATLPPPPGRGRIPSGDARGTRQGGGLRQQCAALPIRARDGEIHVLLITTHGRGHWVIPRGRAETGVPAHGVARLLLGRARVPA